MASVTEPLVNREDPQEDPHDGPEIRRQVEYYFSDENLATDRYLLQCCGGRQNLPVSISRICGFKKMRRFKKKEVVQALLKSTALTVTEDGKQVSRKCAFLGLCVTDEEFYATEEEFYANSGIRYDPQVLLPVPLLPQTKKQYPPGMSKNLMKPTGFENSYVEPPITPDEAKVEDALYDPDKAFVERIEIAIQRFKKKRRMHEKYSHVFNKWMHFGGVESGPRMFGGLSRHDMAGMDAEEIARATASHHIPWDRDDPKNWIVDFVGVGESFLSTYFAIQNSHNTEQVKSGCQVLRSFYNYLLYHTVCPEYRDDLAQALKLCDKAEIELPKTYAAGLALPGDFNTAASTLFGGSNAGLYTGDKEWAIKCKQEGVDLQEMGVTDSHARLTFAAGITVMGTDEQQTMMDLKTVKVIEDVFLSLEVTSIALPTDITRWMFDQRNDFTPPRFHLNPLGTLVCRSWREDDYSEYDLPKDKYPNGRPADTEVGKEYEFWVEEDVLKECFVGMKLQARVLVLEGGVNILDDVAMVMCSFYKCLPNELLLSYHPKQVNVKERKVDGDAEEELVGKNGEGEGKLTEDDSILEEWVEVGNPE